jgi:hypothetical protein
MRHVPSQLTVSVTPPCTKVQVSLLGAVTIGTAVHTIFCPVAVHITCAKFGQRLGQSPLTGVAVQKRWGVFALKASTPSATATRQMHISMIFILFIKKCFLKSKS